tara:strand:- start:39 stop:362 length:324 start_codon:yes stop_codon:yes gene_type:complete
MAELGFFGVVVYTRVHTPLLCGHEFKAADLLFLVNLALPFLTNCDIVGIFYNLFSLSYFSRRRAKVKIKINYSNVNRYILNVFLIIPVNYIKMIKLSLVHKRLSYEN